MPYQDAVLDESSNASGFRLTNLPSSSAPIRATASKSTMLSSLDESQSFDWARTQYQDSYLLKIPKSGAPSSQATAKISRWVGLHATLGGLHPSLVVPGHSSFLI
jgi:hypothetical protein